MTTVEEFANDIRSVDGDHSLGAGALAEALHSLGYRKQEPMSDAEVEAAAWAILKDDPAFNDTYGIEDYRNMARAALVAARAVTNGDTDE